MLRQISRQCLLLKLSYALIEVDCASVFQVTEERLNCCRHGLFHFLLMCGELIKCGFSNYHRVIPRAPSKLNFVSN